MTATPARRWAGPAAGALAVLALGYVAAVDPARPGAYPGCPFLALTGRYCPGCGGLRAVHDLLHGHVAAAAADNVLVVGAALVLPVLVVAGVLAPRVRRAARAVPPAAVAVLAATVAVAFGVLRNLPALTWLAP